MVEVATNVGRLSSSAIMMGKSNTNPLWATRTTYKKLLHVTAIGIVVVHTWIVWFVHGFTDMGCSGCYPVKEEWKNH